MTLQLWASIFNENFVVNLLARSIILFDDFSFVKLLRTIRRVSFIFRFLLKIQKGSGIYNIVETQPSLLNDLRLCFRYTRKSLKIKKFVKANILINA